MDMQRPSAPTTGSVEPPAKRAKVQVTHVEAPTTTTTVAAPFASQPPPGFQDLASSEDPFAVAGTVPITSRTDEPTGGGGGGGGGDVLLPEAEFAASLPQPEVTLQIRIPSDQTQMAWNFYGQIISHSTNVMSTIKTVKQELSKQHLNDMPVNKIQLKIPETGVFAKDGLTLAALNLGPTARLELVPRARGGRK
jgi:UDP-N-acetylglucosamine 2-epimerase